MGGRGASGALAPREKLNYSSMKEILSERSFRYSTRDLSSMAKAANELNKSFDMSTLKSDYGEGGEKAIKEYARQLKSDYNKELKSIQSAVKKYEQGKHDIPATQYNEEKAELEAAKRRKKFFDSFR